jgi:site-specific recombinase XerD
MIGTRPLTDEEIQKCIGSFEISKYSIRNRALFILGLNTGFRISEILSLKIKHVKPYREITDYLTVERRNMKKKQQSRTVVLNETCKQYLRDYLYEYAALFRVEPTPEMYLFKSQKGTNRAISTRQGNEILYKVYDLNEMTGKLATHSMRKTFAKNVHKSLGNDITKTQIALGHRDLSSTRHYLSFDNEEVFDAVRNLNLGQIH